MQDIDDNNNSSRKAQVVQCVIQIETNNKNKKEQLSPRNPPAIIPNHMQS